MRLLNRCLFRWKTRTDRCFTYFVHTVLIYNAVVKLNRPWNREMNPILYFFQFQHTYFLPCNMPRGVLISHYKCDTTVTDNTFSPYYIKYVAGRRLLISTWNPTRVKIERYHSGDIKLLLIIYYEYATYYMFHTVCFTNFDINLNYILKLLP